MARHRRPRRRASTVAVAVLALLVVGMCVLVVAGVLAFGSAGSTRASDARVLAPLQIALALVFGCFTAAFGLLAASTARGVHAGDARWPDVLMPLGIAALSGTVLAVVVSTMPGAASLSVPPIARVAIVASVLTVAVGVAPGPLDLVRGAIRERDWVILVAALPVLALLLLGVVILVVRSRP